MAPKRQQLCTITIQELRDDVLYWQNDEEIPLQHMETRSIREYLESQAESFEDCDACFDEEGLVVSVRDFQPNDGMFCFRLEDSNGNELPFDFDTYSEQQVIHIPDTDLELSVNPILLNLYDELCYGRDHNILAQIAPEVANRFLEVKRDDCSYYVEIRKESHQFAHLCEMCPTFQNAATREVYILKCQDDSRFGNGMVRCEFSTCGLSSDMTDFKFKDILIISAMSETAVKKAVVEGLKLAKNKFNRRLLNALNIHLNLDHDEYEYINKHVYEI